MDYSNEDKEYMEPTHNDSNHELGNASFDLHIDSNPMNDDPIEPRPMEVEFYESTEESPLRADVRREWTVLEYQNYSIQTIPIMIPSTDEHVLYKGTMFMSKDELKYSLVKLALKVKFKYRINRSSKTPFATLCLDIACKFELHASAMKVGNY